MLTFQVLLTETELAEGFLAAFRERYLPEKFFYWLPLSVKAWLELCEGPQPYKNYSRSYELISRHAAEVAGRVRARLGRARVGQAKRIEVVSLGAGQGDKDVLLLEALRAAGCAVRYRPVDSSQALLELAAARAHQSGFAVEGLKADVTSAVTAKALASLAEEPRLVLVLGNTLGVMDPRRFARMLRKLLRREDCLLVDGEIFDERGTLPGYDNPANRRFAFAPLSSVGLEEGRDGTLVFGSDRDAEFDGLHLVTKHFRAARSLKIPLAGQKVPLAAGEKIAMDSSYKYSPAAFAKNLCEIGAFEPLAKYLTGDELFLMWLAAPRGG
jgi:uncharacterized SAM-dependent methyltransferase